MAQVENEDHGVEIEIKSEKSSDLSRGQNDGTVHPDAKPDDKRQNDGTVHPDAKPDDKRQNDGIDLPDSRPWMSSEDEDVGPLERVPDCENCVVMFATMSGKCFVC